METASLGSRGSRGSLGRKSRKSGQFRKSGKSGKRMAILRIVGNLRNFGNLGKTVLKPAASYDNLARSGFASGWSLKCQRENNSLGGDEKYSSVPVGVPFGGTFLGLKNGTFTVNPVGRTA